ncbi:MAG: hypothetical protein E7616_07645 [Ruminococcaceae bacterium]|nr:hypothetical protein [Oscillospiraceae bacterium]
MINKKWLKILKFIPLLGTYITAIWLYIAISKETEMQKQFSISSVYFGLFLGIISVFIPCLAIAIILDSFPEISKAAEIAIYTIVGGTIMNLVFFKYYDNNF